MKYNCNSDEKLNELKKYKDELKSNLAKIIKEKRKHKHLTQLELADELGISYQLLQRYEYGKSLPPVYMMPAICEKLGVDFKDIFIQSTGFNEIIENKNDLKVNADVQIILNEYKNIKRKLNGNQLSEVIISLVNKSKKEREMILKMIK